MPLEEYKRKRDFGKTPEPAGKAGASPAAAAATGPGRRFVVQRHRATRLHYDFRLEVDGVLVSWAVPKGPTLDPKQRRMAVHVEDHPLEYFDFEGVIPARQYGAGDVIVWDWGTWEPEDPPTDPGADIRNGELKFVLRGQKLTGRFTIVRTSGRGGREPFEDGKDQWLLIHKRDDDSVEGWDAEQFPQSVKTGRTNDEVKANRDAIWISQAPAATAEIDLAGAVEKPMPDFIEPMKATLASTPFSDPDWLFEIKWDGFRVEAVIRDRSVRLWTRNQNDASVYFGDLLSPPSWIDAREAIVDGEVVAFEPDGRPDFGVLQERISEIRSGRKQLGGTIAYVAFDLLYLDARVLVDVPLEDRKRLLESVLRPSPIVRYATHVEAEGLAFHKAAEQQRLEGIIAKLRRSRYEPGRRSRAWLKLKIRPEQELVVGGWTPGEGNAKDLGAVAVGVYDDGLLRFAGKVGSGFTAKTRRELLDRLEPLATDQPPFDPPPERKGELRRVVWVRPETVIRAELGGWTRDGVVRQAAFKGIDPGHDPRKVVRERAVESSAAMAEAESRSSAPEPAPERPALRRKASGGRSDGASPARSDPPSAAPAKPASRTPKPASRKSKPAVAKGGRAVPPDGAAWSATEDELAALDGLGKEGVWSVGGHDLKLTNLDKVLFPPKSGSTDGPVTKRELIRYFALIAPTMLPHLGDRPLNLHRYPNGAGAPGFWQKNIPETAPKFLRIWHEVGFEEREDREANDHVVADQVATLCWLANQAAFEIHAWTSTIDDPWRPTFAYVDIDPGEKTTWAETLQIARLYRTAFEHLGVRAYPKVTGRRGLQAWIPIVPHRYTYADTSGWVEKVSRAVGAMVPDLVSWEWSKSERQGRARLDYTQNAPIKTLVAPYAVRPAPGAPVSAPITWDELDDPELRPDRWTIRDEPARVERVGDLFVAAQTEAQELPAV